MPLATLLFAWLLLAQDANVTPDTDLLARARWLRQNGKPNEAIDAYRQILRAVRGGSPSAGAVHAELADAFARAGRYKEAIDHADRCIAASPAHSAEWSSCTILRAEFSVERGDGAAAKSFIETSLRKFDQSGSADEQTRVLLLHALGQWYYRAHQFTAAISTYREALAHAERERTASAKVTAVAVVSEGRVLGSLANALLATHQMDTAAKYARASVERLSSSLGATHLHTVEPLLTLGHVSAVKGVLAEAESHYRLALKIQREHLPGKHPQIAQTYDALANVLVQSGQVSEGKTMLRLALDINRATYGDRSSDVAISYLSLASAYLRLGQSNEAISAAKAGMEILDGQTRADTALVARALQVYAVALGNKNEFGRAQKLLEIALDKQVAALGEQHPFVISTLHLLGSVLVARQRCDRAEVYLLRALEATRSGEGDHPMQSSILSALADCRQHRDPASAAALYERALQLQKATQRTHTLEGKQTVSGYARTLRRLHRDREADRLERLAQEIETKLKMAQYIVDVEDMKLGSR